MCWRTSSGVVAQLSMSSWPASSLHSMLGGSSAGKARNWYRGLPKPRMSSASARRRARPPRPNRYPEAPSALPYSLTPIGYMHSSKRSNSATGSWRSSISSERESSSCCSSSTRSRTVAGSVARAAGGISSQPVQINARIRRRRMSVDPLTWLVLAGASRAVAADECQEHVVRVVPIAAVDGKRGPVGGRRHARRAEQVAELALRVSVLGHGDPGHARFPLVEALGGCQQTSGGSLQAPDPALEMADGAPQRPPTGTATGGGGRRPDGGRIRSAARERCVAAAVAPAREVEEEVVLLARPALPVDCQRRPVGRADSVALVVHVAPPAVRVPVLAHRDAVERTPPNRRSGRPTAP